MREVARDSGSLGRRGGLGCGGLAADLLMTLPQIEHFDVRRGVDLVHRVTGRPARLPVQIVRLYENAVLALASQPDVSLASQIQHNAFP